MDRFSLRDLTRDMTPGAWVSGVSHVALAVWLVSGWGLQSQPIEFEFASVTTISGDDYARLVAATSPQPSTEMNAAPDTPAVDTPPPAPETPAETPPPDPPPQVQPEAPAEEAPPPPAPDPIPQPAQVQDTPPEMSVPEAFVPPPAPVVNSRPQARPADRIASEATAPPPPEAERAPEVQQEASPEADAPVVVEDATEATAPEETATEIVTEADVPSGAPETALRPQTRPQRPTQTAQTPAQTPANNSSSNNSSSTNDDVLAALDAANAGSQSTPASSPAANPGPPMTGSERDSFRLAVSGCWAVDPGSEAARVTVTVAFELDREGRVMGSNVRMVGGSGGSDSAISTAFESARRAILRCQSSTGYQLPAEKYEQWRMVEMTFDPSGMRMQ